MFILMVGSTMMQQCLFTSSICYSISADMVIGFRTAMTTVNETLGSIIIDVHSRITSEVEYTIGFRHIRQRAEGIATVETEAGPIFNTDYDARFGHRPNPNNPSDPLETTHILNVGTDELGIYRELRTTIFPDVHPEEDECYVINIFLIDTVTGGGRANYKCNDNTNNPDDFFCDHTVCILDDDG